MAGTCQTTGFETASGLLAYFTQLVPCFSVKSINSSCSSCDQGFPCFANGTQGMSPTCNAKGMSPATFNRFHFCLRAASCCTSQVFSPSHKELELQTSLDELSTSTSCLQAWAMHTRSSRKPMTTTIEGALFHYLSVFSEVQGPFGDAHMHNTPTHADIHTCTDTLTHAGMNARTHMPMRTGTRTFSPCHKHIKYIMSVRPA